MQTVSMSVMFGNLSDLFRGQTFVVRARAFGRILVSVAAMTLIFGAFADLLADSASENFPVWIGAVVGIVIGSIKLSAA